MSQGQISLEFEWKAFDVFLPVVHVRLKSIMGSNYLGASAGTKLILHLASSPSSDQLAAFEQFWNALTPETEASKYLLESRINAAIAEAQENIIYLSWNDMIPAERKLILKQELSDQDKDALLAKYPNG